jgi:hypothetical protein
MLYLLSMLSQVTAQMCWDLQMQEQVVVVDHREVGHQAALPCHLVA